MANDQLCVCACGCVCVCLFAWGGVAHCWHQNGPAMPSCAIVEKLQELGMVKEGPLVGEQIIIEAYNKPRFIAPGWYCVSTALYISLAELAEAWPADL